MAASHTEVWQHAIVVTVERVATAIQRIVLRPELPTPVKPGEHVNVRIRIRGEDDTRSFSIVDASADGAEFALSVFEGEQSRGGASAMHALRPADRIEVTQPIQDFPLRLNAQRYVLLAGGVGITAIAAMASTLRDRNADYLLVYAGRSRAAMAYLRELEELHGERLVAHIREEGTPLDVEELVELAGEGSELYMCGPIRLMDAVRRAWLQKELPAANLRFETFGNSRWYEPQEFIVRIPALDLEAVVGPAQSMLEALEGAGAEMMYDCRKGECGLCEVRVLALDGILDHRDVFYSERQKDATSKFCCCVSRALAPTGNGPAVVTIQTT